MPFCPQCGSELADADDYCDDCGCRVEERGSDHGQDFHHERSGQRPDQNRPPSRAPPEPQNPHRQQGQSAHRAPPQGQQPRQAPRQSQYPGAPRSGRQSRTRGAQPQYVGNGKVTYAALFPATNGYKGLVLGGLCALGAPLLVPFILLCGYTARLTGAAARGESVRPPFDDVRELMNDGIFYTVLAALVIGVGAVIGNGLLTAGATLDQPGSLSVGAGVVGLAVSYVLPAVLVLYPATGSFSEALSPDRVGALIFSAYYAVSYLIFLGLVVGAFAMGFVLVIAVGILSLVIPFVGIPLAFILVMTLPPYLFYAAGAYWGGTYQIAAQDGLVPDPAETVATGGETDRQAGRDDSYSRT